MSSFDVDRDHSSSDGDMLKYLQEMREEGQLVDVILNVDGVKFPAHRVVLAARCDYFRAMFAPRCGGLKESHLEAGGEVTLGGGAMRPRGLAAVLDYIYMGPGGGTWAGGIAGEQQLVDVLEAAHMLQVPAVLDRCCHLLATSLTGHTALDVLHLADTYTLPALKLTALAYICAHFSMVSRDDSFLELEATHLGAILSSDLRTDCGEVHVLTAVLCWLDHDKLARLVHTPYLLRSVRHHQIHITEHQRKQILRRNVIKCIQRQFPEFDEYFQVKSPEVAVSVGQPVNARGFCDGILLVGGIQYDSGVSNTIWSVATTADMGIVECRALTHIPHLPQSGYGCAGYGTSLYITGGCLINPDTQEESLNGYGFQYDSMTREWSALPRMLQDRHSHYLTVVDTTTSTNDSTGGGLKMFAIAGVTDLDPVAGAAEVATCEMLDLSTRHWSVLRPLPRRVFRFTAVTCGGTSIYVCGGLTDGGAVSRHMLRYDCTSDTWSERCPLPAGGRVDHCMVASRGKLYVFGGWSLQSLTLSHPGIRLLLPGLKSKCPCYHVHCYDTDTDQWSAVGCLPSPRYNAACSLYRPRPAAAGGEAEVEEEEAWIIGGHGSDGPPYLPAAGPPVLSFNLKTYRWREVDVEVEGRSGEGGGVHLWEHHAVNMLTPRNVNTLPFPT